MLLGTHPWRGRGPLVALLCAGLVLAACMENRLPPRTLAPSPAPAASPPAADTGPAAPRKVRRRELMADQAPPAAPDRGDAETRADSRPDTGTDTGAGTGDRPIPDLPDFTTAAGEAPSAAGAEHYIRDLGGAVLAKLRDRSADREEKINYFSALLARDLAVNLIARFALGDHWMRATASQRAAYMAVFGNFIVSSYARRLGGVRVTGFEVIDSRTVGPHDMVVRTRVRHDNGDLVRVDWRLRYNSRRYRIIDLSVGGISMALTMRQEFAAVIADQGGIDGLVETLKTRTRDSL
ncbi:MAG: ABC transporter substrate-binding protein [Hyphomicrobiales bacterium]|nr:ABC transporter substrate-binding protein [Hyphomicrobiales bacterium]